MSEKEHKEFTCILCPRGCRLAVDLDGEAVTVSGNACPKGLEYGRQEAVEPMRSLSTTVTAMGGDRPRLPVRLDRDIPLARILDAMAAIDPVVAHAPVSCGQVLVRDVAGLGADLIATDELPEARDAS